MKKVRPVFLFALPFASSYTSTLTECGLLWQFVLQTRFGIIWIYDAKASYVEKSVLSPRGFWGKQAHMPPAWFSPLWLKAEEMMKRSMLLVADLTSACCRFCCLRPFGLDKFVPQVICSDPFRHRWRKKMNRLEADKAHVDYFIIKCPPGCKMHVGKYINNRRTEVNRYCQCKHEKPTGGLWSNISPSQYCSVSRKHYLILGSNLVAHSCLLSHIFASSERPLQTLLTFCLIGTFSARYTKVYRVQALRVLRCLRLFCRGKMS